jgi:(S)-ureidoglycine aminohydrolase
MNNPAATRSSIRRNHALIAPESHVKSPLPGWSNAQGISLIGPPLGARFVQYLALIEPGGTTGAALPGVARFLYVIDGEVELADAQTRLLAGGYAYIPPDHPSNGRAIVSTRLLVIEKPYVALPSVPRPKLLTNHVDQLTATPFLGDHDALLKKLLPDELAFDFEVNLFTFAPGASLPMVEVHIMEHGLLLLSGQGIYRLDDYWYPVEAGDTIWMGAFCPQWFVAIGKAPARYLYYKDVNRDPLRGSR